MKPIRLYILDFMCYSFGFVDFTLFNSALIVGKASNNELFSNGVGKTTIFKSLEYVLFNQADVNLEKIIRDDTSSCKVVLDFIIDDKEYRVIRIRNKTTTDLSLYQRNAVQGSDDEVLHTVKDNCYNPIIDESLLKKYWKNIGGRRNSDTEKELIKLIKVNFNSFRSTHHFVQNDFTGLSTTTSDKRKAILKEVLSLVVYSKLEKIAKTKASTISKSIDKLNVLIDNIGNPDDNIIKYQDELKDLESKLFLKQEELSVLSEEFNQVNENINKLRDNYNMMTNNFASLLEKEKTLISERDKISLSANEYSLKKANIIKSAQSLVAELKTLKETQEKLNQIDFSKIDEINLSISSKKEEIVKNNLVIQTNMSLYEDLKIPVPNDAVCKHCRQPLSKEHKLLCKNQVTEEIKQCQSNISKSKANVIDINKQIALEQQLLNNLNQSKQKLLDLTNQITVKSKEIQDKRVLHEEYKSILDGFSKDLLDKESAISEVKDELQKSSLSEANNLKEIINKQKQNLLVINTKISSLNKEIFHINSTKAVICHNIEQNKNDAIKKSNYKTDLLGYENKYKIYPHVIQSFSSIGIPSLIIQNVLDDLQVEANNLLTQLKPGLQLSFTVEKTKGDGTQEDKLDIQYTMQGKSRDYDQLSGAMKLAVMFSLKLGLSFLLQKRTGSNIKLLLLDEVDQSLDKASIDAFYEIIKFFEKDFTILTITHNDRMKDKFSNGILVEQDINMVSKAQVVSSW